MNGITPIQFGNQIQEGLTNLALMRQKREQAKQERYNEEFKQKLELMKLIDPKVLNQNLETEISNEAINQVRESVKNYLLDKKNEWASAGQLQQFIQSEVGRITQWNNKFKTVKNNIEEQAKNMANDPMVSKDLWVKAAKSNALFSNGRVKTLEELDADKTDWVTQTWDQSGNTFLRLDEVQSDISKTLNSTPKDKTRVSRTVGATAKKPGEKKEFYIDIPSAFTWDDVNNKVLVKRGADGLIDNQVYTMFVGSPNSAKDKYFTGLTMDQIKSDPNKASSILDPKGKVIDENKFNELKKNIVSGYLEKFAPKVENDIIQQMPAKNETRVTVVTGDNKPTVGSKWMGNMESAWSSGDVAKINQQLKSLYSGGTRLENITFDGVNVIAKFKANAKDPITGDPLPNEVVIPKSDENALSKIAGLYQTARGADKGVEQFVDKKIKVF